MPDSAPHIEVPEVKYASNEPFFASVIILAIVLITSSTYSLGCSFPASRLSISSLPEAQGPE